MAERRMFAKTIIDSDAFLDMPLSAQALYFHLSMRADDDGFINNPKKIQRMIGCGDDDLKLLLLKRFVIPFDSGVCVIKHWKIHNYIRNDRYKPTVYVQEKSQLTVKENGAYTVGIPDGYQMETQVRLGEDSLGKGSIGEVNSISGGGGELARTEAERAVTEYLRGRGVYLPEHFGVERTTIDEAWRFADVLFKRWARRALTSADTENVFFATWQQSQDPDTGEWSVTFPQDKKDLLMYAFEAATNAGKPADWNYIHGVLKNLHQRGITTLEQAEAYDADRDRTWR